MTTSGSHLLCWPGRHNTRIFQCGHGRSRKCAGRVCAQPPNSAGSGALERRHRARQPLWQRTYVCDSATLPRECVRIPHAGCASYCLQEYDDIQFLLNELQSELVRLSNSQDIRRGYEQLANLDVDYREGGAVYQYALGQHDDLGISFATLCWAAQHPHLENWMRNIEAARRPRPLRQKISWGARRDTSGICLYL